MQQNYVYLPLILKQGECIQDFFEPVKLQGKLGFTSPKDRITSYVYEDISDLYLNRFRQLSSREIPFIVVSKTPISEIRIQVDLESGIQKFCQSILGVVDFTQVLKHTREQELESSDFYKFLNELVQSFGTQQESDLLKSLFIRKSTSPVSPVSEKEQNALSKHWQNGNGLGHHQQAGPSNGHHSPTASC